MQEFASRCSDRVSVGRAIGRAHLASAVGLCFLGGSTAWALGDPPQVPQARAQVASAARGSVEGDRPKLDETLKPPAAEVEPILKARRMIADCRARYRSVQDYTCAFFKRERIDGKLSELHSMTMKARVHPNSLYFKFLSPHEGREAIWVEGRNQGKVIAHEAGITKLVAGTMHLDPHGEMAMGENRHSITEAGLGSMIDTIAKRWDKTLIPGMTRVVFHSGAQVGDRPCTMVETIHEPAERSDFSRVCLFIDTELGLPIRFEAYGWPKHPGGPRDLMEEYTYLHLKLNTGLKDRDFDPKNAQYSYGRF